MDVVMRAFGIDTPIVVIPSKLDFNQTQTQQING